MLLFREILWKSLLETMVFTGGEFIARLTLVFLVQHQSSSVWPNYPVLDGRFADLFPKLNHLNKSSGNWSSMARGI